MTYQQLINSLQRLSPEQLEREVVINLTDSCEFINAKTLEISNGEYSEYNVRLGQPFITIFA